MKRILLVVLCCSLLFAACSAQTMDIGEQKTVAAGDQPSEPVLEEPEPTPAAEKTPVPTSTPAPTPTPIPEPTRVTVLAAGDLMCLYAQLSCARKGKEYVFDHCFAEIKDRVSSADLAIANFETLVAQGHKLTGRSPSEGSPKLNAPESYLSAVVDSGFDVLINANNHIFDKKADGVDKTISKIDEYGVMHTGAYATGQERKPLVIDVKGVKIAVLGYTDFINGRPKVGEMADLYSEELVDADIKAVKEAGADFIIVYMHWGNENTHKVAKRQKKEASFVAKAGADIIIGSHPHCLQGTQSIETERGAVPVFYSLGNLISSMGRTINKDSALVNINIEKDAMTGETRLAELSYTPTLCANTDAGRFVIRPAGLESIEKDGNSKSLTSSRNRAVKVMGEEVAQPE